MSIADQITERVLSLEPLQAVAFVCCYLALPDEVPTRPIIERCWEAGKTVLVPKVTGPETMVPVILKAWDELQPGTFGVLEPKMNDTYAGLIDVFIVPGREFSLRGDRRGRGKGYYDRFLARYPNAMRIGLAYESQLTDQLATQPHDVEMTYVVTQKRTFGPFAS